jgi:hypothetical protein
LWIFCDECSSNRCVIPKIDPSDEQRVCDRCYTQVTVGSFVNAETIKPWITLEASSASDAGAGLRYPIDAVVNSKISLWVGNAWSLCVDALAIESPRTFESIAREPTGLEPFDRINYLAGRQFTDELRFLDDCRVGDVKVVKGHHLACKNVLLVGCPYFRRSHEGASFSGLHQCYRRSIEFAIDCGAETLAIRFIAQLDRCMLQELTICSCLAPPRKQWRDTDAARVAMRTVRRSLQRHGSKIRRIVFCLSAGVEEAAYSEAASLYFPRNLNEEATSRAQTAEEQLDEFGDVVCGRGVSIGRQPSETAALSAGSRLEGAAPPDSEWRQTLRRYISCLAAL